MNSEKNDLKIKDVLFSKEDLNKKINQVGMQITEDYKDKESDGVIALCVLKGACFFFSDVVRSFDFKLYLDFVVASSYQNSSKSSGKINILKDCNMDVKGKHIILVEDIYDTGLTLQFLREHYIKKGAASVEICVLLNKQYENTKDFVKYTCFDCPDEFVVGYGIDYAEQFRYLPYVGAVDTKNLD